MATDPILFPRTNLISANSLRRAFEEFLLDKRSGGCTPKTLSGYRDVLRLFLAYLDSQGVTDPGEIAIGHIRRYQDDCRGRGLADTSLLTYARTIRVFLAWCVKEELVDLKLVERIKMPRQPKPLVKPFALDQVQRMLKAARAGLNAQRNTAILLLMLDTGIRASETTNIRPDDVEPEWILIRGKGRKERRVPISATVRRALLAWVRKRPVDGEDYLFLTNRKTQMTYVSLWEMFARLKIVARVEGVRCSPHTARHTTATEFIRDGGNAFELQRLLGHTSLKQTQRYVDMVDEDVARAHREHSLAERLGRKLR